MFNFWNIRQLGIVPLQFATELADGTIRIEMSGVLAIAVYFLVAAVAYLLGSINFAVVVSHGKHHDDIRLHGSKNAGTTNMMRTYGTTSAILTFVGDAAKGLVATAIGGVLMGQVGAGVGCLFCVLGHVYPVFFNFRGGKGVAVAASSILYINPLVFLFIVLLFVAIVWWTKYLSLGSMMASAVYPVLLYSFTAPEYRGVQNVIAVLVACFIIYLHRANIVRLWNGTENKFSFKKSVKPVAPAPETEETDDE